jgi:hypothetical protein
MATKDIEKRRQNWRNWYERNKNNPKHKRVRDFDKKRRRELTEWIESLKAGMQCKVCGFDHPATLDFHHSNLKRNCSM